MFRSMAGFSNARKRHATHAAGITGRRPMWCDIVVHRCQRGALRAPDPPRHRPGRQPAAQHVWANPPLPLHWHTMDHAAAPAHHTVQRHLGMALRCVDDMRALFGPSSGNTTVHSGALSTCIATWVPAAVPPLQLTEVQRQRLDALLARVQVSYDPDNQAHQVFNVK